MPRPLTHQASVIVLLLNEQNEVALMERTGTDTFVGEFCAPGGSIDPGEDSLTAAVREIREEVGVEINPADLEFFVVLDRPSAGIEGARAVSYLFTCRKWQGEFRNMEPDKHGDLQWYPLNQLPERALAVEKMVVPLIGKTSGLVVLK